MDDIKVDIHNMVSICTDNTTLISVLSNTKLDRNWDCIEEDDDHILLKNEEKLLFVRKIK